MKIVDADALRAWIDANERDEVVPVPPAPSMVPLVDDTFDSGFTKWSGNNQVNATLAISGGKMRVSAPGGATGNTYARVIKALTWGEGKEWETEFSISLPSDFWSNLGTATFQPFGWDCWPVPNHQMRLMFWGGDNGLGKMVLKQDGAALSLTSPFALPAGRPVTVKVRQFIHGITGWTKVWLDGTLEASGVGKTWTGKPVLAMRYGWADFSMLQVPKWTEYEFIRLSHVP